MKAYLLTSGTIFMLIVVAHVLRVVSHEAEMMRDPFFILTTLFAGALAVWAFRLLRVTARR
jgi:hypothetical protein